MKQISLNLMTLPKGMPLAKRHPRLNCRAGFFVILSGVEELDKKHTFPAAGRQAAENVLTCLRKAGNAQINFIKKPVSMIAETGFL